VRGLTKYCAGFIVARPKAICRDINVCGSALQGQAVLKRFAAALRRFPKWLVPGLLIAALVSQLVARRCNRENFYETVLTEDGHEMDHVIA